MKTDKLCLIALLLVWSTVAYTQVKIAVPALAGLPHPSAQLELDAASRGLLPPRLTEAQRNAIANPPAGLVVYQTNNQEGLYVRNADAWERIGASIPGPGFWTTAGNSAGLTDFLGTTNHTQLSFRANNAEYMRIRPSGEVGMGTITPLARLHIVGDMAVINHSNTSLPNAGNNPGAGRRMLFYPGKMAFRAGGVSGNQWNMDNVGYGSFSTGFNNIANGASIAIGRINSANRIADLLLGEGNISQFQSNDGNIAFGRNNNFTTLAVGALALGHTNEMRSTLGVALGLGNEIRNHSQISVGLYNVPLANAESARPDNPMEFEPTGGGFFGVKYQGHTIFTIGNGTAPGVLSNALLMQRDGRTTLGSSSFHEFYHLTLPNTNNNGGRIRARAFATTSDARLKTNIRPLQNAASYLLHLQPMQYKHHSSYWKNGRFVLQEAPKTFSIGFIAQQAYSVMPHLVHRPVHDSQELWTLKYTALVALLVAGVQEQQRQLERQWQRITQLEQQLQ
ncbi:MAG TPA: tail fiber domain-containing protein [Phnomibacter sp.]|nr:tail fiber domain-containing protein [Phnomibacter sp.]